ncbi:hypothetical protein DP117_32215 [Brasilonema sp. UFV-L1]|nr:hypothetical protein [Brasilonema sp. UFV-L1]
MAWRNHTQAIARSADAKGVSQGFGIATLVFVPLAADEESYSGVKLAAPGVIAQTESYSGVKLAAAILCRSVNIHPFGYLTQPIDADFASTIYSNECEKNIWLTANGKCQH